MTVPLPGPPPPFPHRPEDPQESITRALARLDAVADRPPAEHVEAFEQVHTALGAALAGPSGPE